MKVAVVGSGISGLVAARELADDHDVQVFEAAPRLGGHTHTVDVITDGISSAIDTGFIVFNERTYPNFVRILRELGVPWRDSEMSFSVCDQRTGLEYNGSSLGGLFSQRRNLLRPRFWRMIQDIARFYRQVREVLDEADPSLTLGQYLKRERFGEEFIERHILPMGAAVWSSGSEKMLSFPVETFVRFFDHHGFLQIKGRPQWLVLEGGSRSYVEPMVRSFRDRIHLQTPIVSVRSLERGVEIKTLRGESARFDRVILACHSDQALRMLVDANDREHEILGSIPYQKNLVTLHTDERVMPKCRRAWASWNVSVMRQQDPRARVTYWMNRLQGLDTPTQHFVTLNDEEGIAEDRILRRLSYDHPVFTPAGIAAQKRHHEIDGRRGVHFCGAYWGYGFHEDGVVSALEVAQSLRSLQRAVAR